MGQVLELGVNCNFVLVIAKVEWCYNYSKVEQEGHKRRCVTSQTKGY